MNSPNCVMSNCKCVGCDWSRNGGQRRYHGDCHWSWVACCLLLLSLYSVPCCSLPTTSTTTNTDGNSDPSFARGSHHVPPVPADSLHSRSSSSLQPQTRVLSDPPKDCSRVKSLLETKTGLRDVTDTFQAGASLAVCESRDTCCSANAEAALQRTATEDFQKALRTQSQPVADNFIQAAHDIQSHLVRHIQASMTKTQTMFGQLYKRVAVLAREPILNLFADLEKFIGGLEQPTTTIAASLAIATIPIHPTTPTSSSSSSSGELDVAAAVSRFFDDLFPRLYGQGPTNLASVLQSQATTWRALSSDDMECLRNSQADIKPFGEIPRRLAQSLARSLDAAKALMAALHVGVQVLNATQTGDLSADCRPALLRTTYCAQCQGHAHTTIRPCRGLCMNVARGCLAAVSDVDQPWNDWIDSMERLTQAVLGSPQLGAHDILASIDSRLSEAVIYALENGPNLEKKVKRECGPVNASVVEMAVPPVPTDSEMMDAADATGDEIKDISGVQESTSAALRSRLQALLPILATARGFYANLPDAVCTTGNTNNNNNGPAMEWPTTGQEANCWNGHRFGEYSKVIAGIGTSAQKYNPEVKVTRPDADVQFAHVTDALRHVRQGLVSKTILSPEPDSLVMEDFGSGSGHGHAGGDTGRDFMEGEDRDGYGRNAMGSGSGYGPDDEDDNEGGSPRVKQAGSDIGFEDNATPTVAGVPGSGSGPASAAATSRTLLVIALLTGLATWQFSLRQH